MKKFEYMKLNFNMAQNETMIAMILAFIAPLIASLGERFGMRSFLMGTDGPATIQIVAGWTFMLLAIVLLVRGLIKIAYDNLFGETAQLYSSIPVSMSTVAVTKIIVLTLNTIIVLSGLAIGMVMAYIFGNNPAIESFFEKVVSWATSGASEQMIIILLGLLAILSLAFFANAYILCGFAKSGMRPKSLLGKWGLLIFAMIPLAPIGFLIEGYATKIDLSVELESLRILIMVIIGGSLLLGLCSTWLCANWLNKTYYI